MELDPKCFINISLALLGLILYMIGSYRFYKNKKGYTLIIGAAIFMDIATAILASLRITPTTQIPGTVVVPWHSLLFNFHVCLSMAGFTGFILLFIYLLFTRPERYRAWIRKWQFMALLPVWVIGEGIALCNAVLKLSCRIRLFNLV